MSMVLAEVSKKSHLSFQCPIPHPADFDNIREKSIHHRPYIVIIFDLNVLDFQIRTGMAFGESTI